MKVLKAFGISTLTLIGTAVIAGVYNYSRIEQQELEFRRELIESYKNDSTKISKAKENRERAKYERIVRKLDNNRYKELRNQYCTSIDIWKREAEKAQATADSLNHRNIFEGMQAAKK